MTAVTGDKRLSVDDGWKLLWPWDDSGAVDGDEWLSVDVGWKLHKQSYSYISTYRSICFAVGHLFNSYILVFLAYLIETLHLSML